MMCARWKPTGKESDVAAVSGEKILAFFLGPFTGSSECIASSVKFQQGMNCNEYLYKSRSFCAFLRWSSASFITLKIFCYNFFLEKSCLKVYLGFLILWFVGTPDQCHTVPLTYPAEVRHGFHDHDSGSVLCPDLFECGKADSS